MVWLTLSNTIYYNYYDTMRDKYIGIFKKSMVILVILFVIVCFSFGVTYSNFIYNSTEHRAVEMHVSKLIYGIKINNDTVSEIDIKPGINIYDIEIKSINQISSYYKLLIQNNPNIKAYSLDGNSLGTIEEDETKSTKLIIFNSGETNIKIKFLINGGYITNTINDIRINEGYIDISKLNIGDNIKYSVHNTYQVDNDYSEIDNLTLNTSSDSFKILNIYGDGSLDIISSEGVLVKNIIFNGSNGYNNFNYIINELCNNLYYSEYITSIKNTNILDIEKYAKNIVISQDGMISINHEMYVPASAVLSNSIIIDDNIGSLSNNEIILIDKLNSKRQVNSGTIVKEKINNIEFDNAIYNELLLNTDYILSTRMTRIDNNNILFGLYNINNRTVDASYLYNSLDVDLNRFSKNPPLLFANDSSIFGLPLLK